jgi:glutamyl-Q tRNA(Asp) synthetase
VELKNYRGRFAPSPSGELHFGSLLAAMSSYADARHHNGSWLLRIDDIDTARVVPQSDQHILTTLEQCGFEWDETVSYQSQFLQHYEHALEQLNKAGVTYPCTCSRKQIKQLSNNGIYPGTCRTQSFNTISSDSDYAVRIKVSADETGFMDLIQNRYSQQLDISVGDFVIFRRDKVFTYQLSVVVDDFISQISHVIRGYDLLDSTPRQVYLQHLLGYPSPKYAHIPLAVTYDNELKLSKLSHAKKISCDIETLVLAARFLGQPVLSHSNYENKADFWQHLFQIWSLNRVPKMEKQKIMY